LVRLSKDDNDDEDDSPTKEFVLRCRNDNDEEDDDEDEDENNSNAADPKEMLGLMINVVKTNSIIAAVESFTIVTGVQVFPAKPRRKRPKF
jgi:DNA replicative helicase MCM subunit Mcm2 (Cdc46/Mcm family)